MLSHPQTISQGQIQVLERKKKGVHRTLLIPIAYNLNSNQLLCKTLNSTKKRKTISLPDRKKLKVLLNLKGKL